MPFNMWIDQNGSSVCEYVSNAELIRDIEIRGRKINQCEVRIR